MTYCNLFPFASSAIEHHDVSMSTTHTKMLSDCTSINTVLTVSQVVSFYIYT